MKYMGSKARLAKHILPIMLKDRKPNQWFVEPFCGGCNIIDKVDGNRIANDAHPYLIAMFRELANGWEPPVTIPESIYNFVKKNRKKFPPYLVGYIGFNISYGGKWWGGYSRDKTGKRDYSYEAYRHMMKQAQ